MFQHLQFLQDFAESLLKGLEWPQLGQDLNQHSLSLATAAVVCAQGNATRVIDASAELVLHLGADSKKIHTPRPESLPDSQKGNIKIRLSRKFPEKVSRKFPEKVNKALCALRAAHVGTSLIICAGRDGKKNFEGFCKASVSTGPPRAWLWS